MRPLTLDTPVPEHLPGEPDRRPASPAMTAAKILVRAPYVAIYLAVTATLWPMLLVSVLIWGWPPIITRRAHAIHTLRRIWTHQPPAPGSSTLRRVWLTLTVFEKLASIPLWGLAWQLDELLYGRDLDATPITAPLLEISAGRSGSTQLARYLEDDPHLVAPNLLQTMIPILWAWRLGAATIGRWFTEEQVRQRLLSQLNPEFIERHEADPFRTDTFDAALYTSHLNFIASSISPEAGTEDFAFTAETPMRRVQWEEDFVALTDRIGRKTLLFAGPAQDGRPRRLFVKGHFLGAADALARRWPDARFLTMIREPAPRLQSAVNYLRANPHDPTIGPVPWAWLGASVVDAEVRYCEQERAWFTRPDGPRRCVLRFADYVADLEQAMTKVYVECLDEPTLPAHVPREHPPRERTNYLFNRSLAQVGIDQDALNERLADYRAWCARSPRPSA
jgi:hypothetical protein